MFNELQKHNKGLGLEIWIMFSAKFEVVLYNKAIDFEIMSNFCIEQFLIWRRFVIQIVGTMDPT